MIDMNILSISTSLIAVAISVTSLIRTRKMDDRQIKFQKENSNLIKLQIDKIMKENSEEQKPRVKVELINSGNAHNFIIANHGPGDAYNVDFELIDCPMSPIINEYFEARIPCKQLRAKSRIKILAAMHLGSPLKYDVKLTWEEASGQKHEEMFEVHK